MTLQEWIVAIVILLCVAEVVRRSVRFVRSAKISGNPCDGCVSGCDLKRSLEGRQSKCPEHQEKSKKKYCS